MARSMSLRRLVGLVAVAMFAGTASGQPQSLYRYVDANGRVYYSDRAPTEGVGRAVDHVSRGGTVVRRGEAAPTAAEYAARDEARRKREIEERQVQAESRRNSALIITYPHEQDIDDARASSLKPHEETIKEAMQRIALQKSRGDKLRADLAARQAQKKPAPPNLEQELRDSEVELKALGELLASKQRDVAVVNARFDEDKRRWAEIAKSRTPAQLQPTEARRQ